MSDGVSDVGSDEFFDRETGELIGDFMLVTAAVTVENPNVGDFDGNRGVNDFPNALLTVVNSGQYVSGQEQQSLEYNDRVVWDGENPVAGQIAYVHIEPGESVSYRLGFVLAYRYSVDNSYLCTRSYEPRYLPVSLGR